ncbi:putative mitochondrial pyruvate carrier 2 [Metarhizium anisopliae]
MRASRPALRQGAFSAQASQAFRAQRFRFRESSKRWQSTADGAQQQHQSWFKRAWESEVGIKTVHFWSATQTPPLTNNKVADANNDWQWALVLAGISDFARPAEKLSFTQNFALTCTGLIWTRWCLIIKPKNYLLAAVNFFLGLVGIVQVSRILMYESAKKKGLAEVVEDVKKDVKDQVKA